MKIFKPLLPVILFLVFCSFSELSSGQLADSAVYNDTVSKYHDGYYGGLSRGYYTDEPYWGFVSFSIEKGLFSGIRFSIRDSALHEYFDSSYERHFAGNQEYIKQSRNDWQGVRLYPGKLETVQDTTALDAVSGATWSYNIFRAALTDAFKKGAGASGTLTEAGR
jgi:major membrane immunogen (membrane-anchored lipoprotein)